MTPSKETEWRQPFTTGSRVHWKENNPDDDRSPVFTKQRGILVRMRRMRFLPPYGMAFACDLICGGWGDRNQQTKSGPTFKAAGIGGKRSQSKPTNNTQAWDPNTGWGNERKIQTGSVPHRRLYRREGAASHPPASRLLDRTSELKKKEGGSDDGNNGVEGWLLEPNNCQLGEESAELRNISASWSATPYDTRPHKHRSGTTKQNLHFEGLNKTIAQTLRGKSVHSDHDPLLWFKISTISIDLVA